MRSNRATPALCALALATSMSACAGHANPSIPAAQPLQHVIQPLDVIGGPASMQVLLGDAPPDLGGRKLRRLDLGIKEIDAIENGQVTVLASYERPRVVNVLAHQDDGGEPIADAHVARSDYQQLRLVVDLASSSAKLTGGPSMPVDFLVNVASASSAGAGATTLTTSDGPGAVDLTVTQPFSIARSEHHAVRVDFNAFESLALDGAGNLLARASLFVAPYDQMGRIRGRVIDSSGAPVSNATVVALASDGSVANTDFTNRRGRFVVGTLRAGTYHLVIYNHYTTASGRVVDASGESSGNAGVQSFAGPSVTVTPGDAANAGSIGD